MTKQWLFQHNWAMRVSKCVIYCKNIYDANPKYQIIFNFIDGEKYSVDFSDRRTRDNHFRFFVRMMQQNYADPYTSYLHWAGHILSLCIIVFMATIICVPNL